MNTRALLRSRKSVFLLLLICFLSACGNKSSKQQEEVYEGDLQELRLGAMSSMDYVPFVLAKKQGIYDSLGLNLDIVKFFSANERDAAFQSGNIDGTVIDFTGAIIQQANGIDLKLVMKNDGFFYLIAGKETNIQNLSDLKGKNIAVSRNTVIEFSTDKALESVGLDPTNVNKPEINKIPLRYEMLQNGQIDASTFPDPFATMAISNGNLSLTTTKDLGISVTGTMFTGKAIQDKKREIEVLIKGYNQAIEFIKKEPLSAWSQLLIDDTGLPASLLNEIKLPDYQKAALPSDTDINSTVQWLKEKKLIPDAYMPTDLVESTLIKK